MLSELRIDDRRLVADGEPFGAAGPYETLTGRASFALDPAQPLNAPICDLALAPRDAAGRVRFSADLWIVRPSEAARGNGTLLFDVLNRGNKTALRLNNALVNNRPQRAEHLGDGLLMRRGVTIAACAWQWDATDGLGRMTMQAPSAPVSGPVRCQFVPGRQTALMPLADRDHLPLEPADPEQPDAVLTVRDAPFDPPRPLPRGAWRFCGRPAAENGGTPAPGRSHLWLEGGFAPGRIYEVVFRGENPPLAGLGFAAVRDFVSCLRYERGEANPLAEQGGPLPARAIAWGVSQSGRFLRHFLYEGFNEDETGRMVFDGVLCDIAGAPRGSFNHRFAQPSRFDRGHEGNGYPTEQYPFHDLPVPDPLSGRNAGQLDRLLARGRAPKLFYTNSSNEYWAKGASLIHTDPLGTRDAPPAENVRIYHFAGTGHVAGPFPPGAAGNQPGVADPIGRYPATPVDRRASLRALFLALEAWVRDGSEPPASCYPRLADRTLVSGAAAASQWPAVPGVRFPPGSRPAYEPDYGPDWPRGVIAQEPPAAGREYPTLVPALDADGNELGGIRLPEVAVPLASYTGWNLRHPDTGAPEALANVLGSIFPFAATPEQAAAQGDPRRSIAERYTDRDDYLQRVRAAADELIARRLLLSEDLPVVMERAAAGWALFAQPAAAAAAASRPA
ncbi:MAG TPA: alpha/beta hydrolase domain-containing protein [Dehalococcoidia bacterium]|nr:alpha/beta hydrolase domain-containing protein [Dehalococcoidia bacterium]